MRALFALSLAACVAGFQEQPPEVRFSEDVVFVEKASGDVIRFDVELALTPAQRVRGLMFREELAPDAGMLFDFRPAREVGIWMKNTLISLDVIFIRADGVIAGIARDAAPLSESVMRSGEPVTGVLEIAGGRAAELGLAPGDRVRHALFDAPR